MDAPSLHALADRFYAEDGTRKPAHYLDLYAALLGPLRDVELDVLEVGVSSGASLRLWREFLPRARLVGLELAAMPAVLAPQVAAGEIRFVQGDQSDPAGWAACLAQARTGRFHVIVDDASHVGHLSRATFEGLFNDGLHEGGLYVLEDYGTGYMPGFPDGQPFAAPPRSPEQREFPSHHHGMVGWLKQLVDEIHMREIGGALPQRFPIAWLQIHHSIALVQKRGARPLVRQFFAPG